MARAAALLVAMIALGACAPAAVAPPAVKTQPIAFVPDAGGIQVTGQPGRIDFGRTDHSAIPAMTRLVGSGPVSQEACGAVSSVTWPDQTTLYFTAGDFRGWSSPTGSAGLTCGEA
jgi:hypothetical protein